MKSTSLIVCISLALSSAAALAGDDHSNSVLGVAIPSFESLDRNMDGRLSRSEAGFDRWLSYTFAVSDVDGDGFVSRVEYDSALRDGDRHSLTTK